MASVESARCCPVLPCFLPCVLQSGRASARYGFVLVQPELLPLRGCHGAKKRSGVACEPVNIISLVSSVCTYEAGAAVITFIVKYWMAEEPTCNTILGFCPGEYHSRKW